MTTRPGQVAEIYLAKTTGKRLCTLISIITEFGPGRLYVTDHDREITVDGITYSPMGFGGASFDRREAAFRAGFGQAFGYFDGVNVIIDDIAGGKYRGAKIVVKLVDWKYPWITVAETHFVVSGIKWTDSSWNATLQNLTMRLQLERGGRFNGLHSARCTYALGGQYCKKDISSLTNNGVTVATEVTARQKFTTIASRWQNTQSDNYFREGEFTFMWKPPELQSQTTSNVTAGTFTLADTSQSWTTNEHVGKWVRILSGNLGYVQEYALITANTATTITIGGSAWTGSYTSPHYYDICVSSDLINFSAPIADYVASSRTITLFFPLPIALPIGDSGIVKPGCDGLLSTCISKFANQLNFGGIDVNAPKASDIIKAPEDN